MADIPSVRGWEWRISGKDDYWSAQLDPIYTEFELARYVTGGHATPLEALEASIALYVEDVAKKRIAEREAKNGET